jgi:hypothetical protein
MTMKSQSCILALAVAVALGIAAHPGLAVPRHKTVAVQEGTPTRVANHTYFKSATCEAPSVPKIVVRQKPTKGVLKVTEGVLPLRRARTEQGKKCIGKSMRTAILEFTASPKSSGDDVIAYDVIFPSSCKRCKNFEVTVAVSIGVDLPQPTTSPDTGDDGDG